MQTLQWFKDRIGKVIYRDKSSCTCLHCNNTVINGLTIADESHANWLYEVQNTYAEDGVKLNYRDSL